MNKRFPLFKVHVPSEQALANIKEVFASGFINEGIQVTQLTEALRTKLDAKNLLLMNSCTSAITLALHLAGVGHGDEVISTPMTCIASNTPIALAGARIVWADIDPRSGLIDPIDVAKKITPRTKAVMAVAWAGTPPELDDLCRVCRESGVKLILDAAHAFGAEYYDGVLAQVNEWPDFTTYSFQAIKHFTTGDGGALVCRDNDDFARAKALKWFGFDRDRAKDANGDWKGQQWDVDVYEPGYKFNMNNVAAAIGLSQLDHIDSVLHRHRSNMFTYDGLFRDSPDCAIVPAQRKFGTLSSAWVYTVRLRNGTSSVNRDGLLRALNDEGIMAGVVHVPNDTYAAFKRFDTCRLPGVRDFSANQFSLPCGWWMSTDDVVQVFERVHALTS